MSQPKLLDSALYALLHKDDIAGFNKARPKDGPIDMRGGDFRGLDLRELNARGVDFQNSRLEGASVAHAQISGAYFPVQLKAAEILMSVQFGTRMRYEPE